MLHNTELADVGCSGYAGIGLNDRNRKSNFVWLMVLILFIIIGGFGQSNTCCQAQQDRVEYGRDDSVI